MPKTEPRDNPCYCINIRRAANVLTKCYDRAFAPFSVTTNQFSLLNDVRLLGSCNKSELAQFARLDRTTIIRNLSGLMEKGLVEDVPGENNRHHNIRLTPAGEAVAAQGMASWKQVQKQIESAIGAENIPVLKQILANIGALDKQ